MTTCFHPDCEKSLRSGNKSGACQEHQSLAWYHANKEQSAERMRRWRAANAEHVFEMERDRSALRRARKRGVPNEKIVRSVVFERDGGVCHICQLEVDPAWWHMDHVVPISAGGGHTYDNVAVSHPACNQSKGAKTSGWQRPDASGRA